LDDLLPAAEPVGDDERAVVRIADGGQQHPFATGNGHVVVGASMCATSSTFMPRITSASVSTRRERRGFFMSYLNESDLLGPGAKRLEHAVDAIAGQTENGIHAPGDQAVDEQIGHGW